MRENNINPTLEIALNTPFSRNTSHSRAANDIDTLAFDFAPLIEVPRAQKTRRIPLVLGDKKRFPSGAAVVRISGFSVRALSLLRLSQRIGPEHEEKNIKPGGFCGDRRLGFSFFICPREIMGRVIDLGTLRRRSPR